MKASNEMGICVILNKFINIKIPGEKKINNEKKRQLHQKDSKVINK